MDGIAIDVYWNLEGLTEGKSSLKYSYAAVYNFKNHFRVFRVFRGSFYKFWYKKNCRLRRAAFLLKIMKIQAIPLQTTNGTVAAPSTDLRNDEFFLAAKAD